MTDKDRLIELYKSFGIPYEEWSMDGFGQVVETTGCGGKDYQGYEFPFAMTFDDNGKFIGCGAYE